MDIAFKKLDDRAITPTYGTAGAAAFDIYPVGDPRPHKKSSNAVVFDTGLAFEVPESHVMLVFSRSGQGFNEAMRLSNCVGVIDSDYRGELKVSLQFDGDSCPVFAKPNTAIAQGMIIQVDQVNFVQVDELSSTERGENGFGSTNKT